VRETSSIDNNAEISFLAVRTPTLINQETQQFKKDTADENRDDEI
jgi:hypothetical protein